MSRGKKEISGQKRSDKKQILFRQNDHFTTLYFLALVLDKFGACVLRFSKINFWQVFWPLNLFRFWGGAILWKKNNLNLKSFCIIYYRESVWVFFSFVGKIYRKVFNQKMLETKWNNLRFLLVFCFSFRMMKKYN